MGEPAAVEGRSSPWSQRCTPRVAVTSRGPSRPCARVRAVAMGGRKMVASSPLGDVGAPSECDDLGSLLGRSEMGGRCGYPECE